MKIDRNYRKFNTQYKSEEIWNYLRKCVRNIIVRATEKNYIDKRQAQIATIEWVSLAGDAAQGRSGWSKKKQKIGILRVRKLRSL